MAISPQDTTRTLSEFDSKQRLANAGVPFPDEALVADPDEAVAAAERLGFPVVAKLCGDAIAHKTERGLVKLSLSDPQEVHEATTALLASARPEDAARGVLIAPMLAGARELIAGVVIDPTFGHSVMLGIGGIFAEALADVVFRLVPLSPEDAEDMVDDLQHASWLDEFRGEPAVERSRLADVLLALSNFAETNADIVAVDINPLIIVDGDPVAVDALVEVAK